jgi:hypothetical protein
MLPEILIPRLYLYSGKGMKREQTSMSEVTVNDELKLGFCLFLSKAGLTRQSFIDTLYKLSFLFVILI